MTHLPLRLILSVVPITFAVGLLWMRFVTFPRVLAVLYTSKAYRDRYTDDLWENNKRIHGMQKQLALFAALGQMMPMSIVWLSPDMHNVAMPMIAWSCAFAAPYIGLHHLKREADRIETREFYRETVLSALWTWERAVCPTESQLAVRIAMAHPKVAVRDDDVVDTLLDLRDEGLAVRFDTGQWGLTPEGHRFAESFPWRDTN